MTSRSTRVRAALVAGAAIVAGSLSALASPQVASAQPNDCNKAYVNLDFLGANTGTLYHTCSAGTQVTYQVDCVISDSYYTHYFATASQLRLDVSCPYSMGPMVGLYDYSFS